MFLSRRRFVGFGAFLAGAARMAFARNLSIRGGGHAAVAPQPVSGDLSLWYDKPAEVWKDALPVGNGRLGGMVFGGVTSERIALNEDTLWSGAPRDWNNPDAVNHLAEVRKLVIQDQNYHGADDLCHKLMGPWNENYLPLGDLKLDLHHAGAVEAYRRDLDLETALASVRYAVGGVTFVREVFASAPDNVVVVWLTASKPGAIDCTLRLSSLLKSQSASWVDGKLAKVELTGKAPSHSLPSYVDTPNPVQYSDDLGKGMYFASVLHCSTEGGKVTANPDGSLSVAGASRMLLTIGAATGYQGFAVAPAKPLAEVLKAAQKDAAVAQNRSYVALLQRHRADYQRLFRRVSLELGPTPTKPKPATDKRVVNFADEPDPALLALVFHYGRYLLISSSRIGSQPANLQGLWNAEVRPPWSCNWTSNINVQMNYWGAETCNLSECALPLIEMVKDLSVNGAVTAKVNYGAKGWVSHHNIDLWRQSAPAGDYGVAWAQPTWANYAMSGPWLCSHLWEHYRFTGDREYLRTQAYPVMKGCAEFCLDWLIDDGKGGLTTCPSVSTENIFNAPDGKQACVSAGCTHDIAVITEIFTSCRDACGVLGIDDEFAEKLSGMLKRMPPYQIGRFGQLQEWSVDFDEPVPGMRHMSHLYPVYPGGQITPRATPELAKAARASLERRLHYAATDGTFTGWGRAWAIGLWARFGDGDMAWESLKMLVNHSLNQNLFDDVNDTHPKVPANDFIFQIDANFGGPASIAEMLLQSHEGEIAILQAWPKDWTEGRVSGLKARGGTEVDVSWKSLKAADVVLRKTGNAKLIVRAPKGYRIANAASAKDGKRSELKLPAEAHETFSFQAKAGETYHFTLVLA